MAAICCSSSVLFIPIFTFGIYLYKTTPTRHARYHSVQSPLAWFFISSPPAWAGICRTARQGCLIPYSSLSRCNIPRTPLRLPESPAEVSLSPGFSEQNAAAAPCRECRSYFPFFYYDSSSYLYKSTATCFPQTNTSPRSSPLITCISVPDVLCPYILIFHSGRHKNRRDIYCQGSTPANGIYLQQSSSGLHCGIFFC